MKALFLTHNLRERGSYFRALEIAKRLAARGHEVDFGFVSEWKKYRPQLHEEQVGSGLLRCIEFPYWTLFNDKQEGWGVFDNFCRTVRVLRGGYDFLYAFSHKPSCVFPAWLGHLACPRFVLDWSDWWSGPEGLYQACVLPSAGFQSLPRPMRWARRAVFAIEQWWEPRIWRFAHAVTLISSEFFRHPFVEREELRPKAYVMHSGASLDAIKPMDKNEARKLIGIEFPPEAVVFGYVANFHTDERLLLEAFARHLVENPYSFLLVVGSDFENMTPDIYECVRERVVHVGRQPFTRIGLYLAAADVLLLPLTNIALNRARYPHKLSDYVAAGRPLIACDVGETGRLLRKYSIGLLTEPNAYSFAKAMSSAVALRDSWDRMGSDVRKAAETYFDWDKLCTGLFEFLSRRLDLNL